MQVKAVLAVMVGLMGIVGAGVYDMFTDAGVLVDVGIYGVGLLMGAAVLHQWFSQSSKAHDKKRRNSY